jgi:hypothetical protein
MPCGAVEQKNGIRQEDPSRIALDETTFSNTTSKRQSGAPSRMITIRGTSDHHHLEFVITITWNG